MVMVVMFTYVNLGSYALSDQLLVSAKDASLGVNVDKVHFKRDTLGLCMIMRGTYNVIKLLVVTTIRPSLQN